MTFNFDALIVLCEVVWFACIVVFAVYLIADDRAKIRRMDKILDELNSQNQYHYEKTTKEYK